jgi:predicted lipoprotein with Yx(FWY)xxD motif
MVQTEQTPLVSVEASHDDRRLPGFWSGLGARLPLLTFLAVEVAMFVRVLVLAPNKWFAYDEWEFLAGRTAGSTQSLFRPTIGHWVTLPILVYRGLYQLFGLRTYLPYELVLVVLHLTAAALLFAVMRRAGVGPWIATVAASLFALFGAGWQDITWAFQIDFVGALVLGLAQLLLADHDGRIDRRDWLGLLAGAAALMCSGVGVIMALVVGLATLGRRGWRVALFHTVPLAAVYLGWWLGYARTYEGSRGSSDLGMLARWSWIGYRTAFEAMGQFTVVGILLAVILAVGLAVAVASYDLAKLRTRVSASAALLVGAIVFVVAAGWQRQVFHEFKLDHAADSQYSYIFVAMALPALAVAVNAIGRRWRFLLPVALVPLLIGIPGNVQALSSKPTGLFQTQAEVTYRQTMVALASVPVAHQVPRSTPVYDMTSLFAPSPPPLDVTLGWLLDQKAAGRLPSSGPLDPRLEADATLSLALKQSQGTSGSAPITTSGSPTAQPVQSTTPAAPTSSPPLVRIENSAKVGPILVDTFGRTLYTLTNGLSPIPCEGACGGIWHPLLAPPGTAAPAGGPGVSGLGRTASGAGVTDWGFPLFVYSGDKTPGQASGDGIKSFGGTWHVIKAQAPKTCSTLVTPTTKVLQKGQSIEISGYGLGVINQFGHVQSDEVIFYPTKGNTLSVLAGPLTVQLLPVGSKTTVCL